MQNRRILDEDEGVRAMSEQRTTEERDWQPIETAPKDGSGILIAGGTYIYSDYEPMPFLSVTIAQWYQDGWRGDTFAHDEWNVHKPTHWMRLPEPPK